MENVVGMSTPWAGRRVFVTGATGLIGSWVVKELLQGGASVTCLIEDLNPGSELVRSEAIRDVTAVSGSLTDFNALERVINVYEPEVVFHLGARTVVGQALRSPLNALEVNVRGTYNLLEACRLHKGMIDRVVIASSDKAYGEQSELPYTEDAPLIGRAPYDVSKTSADLIAQAYYHSYGLPVTIARCGNTYGGGDLNWSRLIPGTVRAFLRGESPIIRRDGTYLRDYIYVRDVSRAYFTFGSQSLGIVAGEAFNFSDESPRTVIEIVSALQAAIGCPGIEPEIQSSTEAEIKSQYLSAEKAKRTLGWSPEFSLEQGLDETIAWYSTYLGADR